MIQIRQNIFETNSSSTHSIVVSKENPIPGTPNIYGASYATYEDGVLRLSEDNSFGWGWEVLSEWLDKFAYAVAELQYNENELEEMLEKVKKHLDCEHGIVLNNPAFTKYLVEYGEISSYPAGYKENAGIFCHNNPWVIIGETVLGRGDYAWDYYRKICPSYTEANSALHKVEPYVYSQMIAGKDAARPGEAKNSWLTGTAAWNWYAITQYILGIKPAYDGIQIDPCICSQWKEYKVTRRFRGSTYEITVKNPDGVCKGIREILLDGQPFEGNIVPHTPGTHTVTVTLG